MIKRLRFPVKFTVAVRSPFVMAGVDASGIGIDTPALRDELAQPVLPGDHLKGLLREAFLALGVPQAANDGLSINAMFGRKSAAERAETAEDSNAPERGRLRLRDLWAEKMLYPRLDDPDQFETEARNIAEWRKKAIGGEEQEGRPDITRIQIDQATGAAKRGALQVVELVAPLGALALFEGEGLFYGTESEARPIADLLKKALALIPYFGGLRTIGFGEHCVSHSRIEIQAGKPIVPAAAESGRSPSMPCVYEGTFSHAFLVSAALLADNVYEGSAKIPGAAIKGALADMLAQGGIDTAGKTPHARALAKIRISHARPLHAVRADGNTTSSDARKDVLLFEAGRPLPLSLMRNPRFGRTGDTSSVEFQCAFDAAEPGLINGICSDFQPDWKPRWFARARAEALRPQDDLAKLSRGHTRISRLTGTAEDGNLFIEIARGFVYDPPGKLDAPIDFKRCKFRFSVDCHSGEAWPADEKAALAEILGVLESGIDNLGKTNARFSLHRSVAPTHSTPDPSRKRWKVLLETDAVLADPDADNAPGSVMLALQVYFQKILPGTKLIDWYARRTLAGGYLGMRRRAGGKDAPYRPWSLFAAGSCFLIEALPGNTSAVADKLAEFLRTGLPVYRWKPDGLACVDDWRNCPFVPENGFGEISVDDRAFAISGKKIVGGAG